MPDTLDIQWLREVPPEVRARAEEHAHKFLAIRAGDELVYGCFRCGQEPTTRLLIFWVAPMQHWWLCERCYPEQRRGLRTAIAIVHIPPNGGESNE